MKNKQLEKSYAGRGLESARRFRNQIKAGKLPRWIDDTKSKGTKRWASGHIKQLCAIETFVLGEDV